MSAIARIEDVGFGLSDPVSGALRWRRDFAPVDTTGKTRPFGLVLARRALLLVNAADCPSR